MNAAAEVHGLWREKYAAAHKENQARRARVLMHPDIAAKLCEPPLSFAKPEQWNGFVPPKYLPADERGKVALNDSPRRAALVGIAAEAMRREGEQDE